MKKTPGVYAYPFRRYRAPLKCMQSCSATLAPPMHCLNLKYGSLLKAIQDLKNDHIRAQMWQIAADIVQCDSICAMWLFTETTSYVGAIGKNVDFRQHEKFSNRRRALEFFENQCFEVRFVISAFLNIRNHPVAIAVVNKWWSRPTLLPIISQWAKIKLPVLCFILSLYEWNRIR